MKMIAPAVFMVVISFRQEHDCSAQSERLLPFGGDDTLLCQFSHDEPDDFRPDLLC